ncbi:hypothetical protein [Sphingomonas alpina]|uniref:Uncharacterized protein n=1 Tax=Sphingomonas alpina TaxID=653931 RepID=A0A7H0LQ23_9SPHN|nr:hypothetical protein [Sphingomonas alpina]QNQ11776.1 hypothetical protein H3Z74_11935 [Sphingomonas alpina]
MDSYEFPTDLPDDTNDGADGSAGTLRWTATIVVLTTMFLALFNAHTLTGWAEDLPPGPAVVKVVAAANTWEQATADLGLGSGHARMHKAWTRLERKGWSGEGDVQMAQR